jgi:hypothetical protein
MRLVTEVYGYKILNTEESPKRSDKMTRGRTLRGGRRGDGWSGIEYNK